MTLSVSEISSILDAAGAKYEYSDIDGGVFASESFRVYLDDQDASNVGWAYRTDDDSGSIDCAADVKCLVNRSRIGGSVRSL